LDKSTKIPLKIRPMTQKDLHQVAVVEKDSFPELFPPTAFSKELKRQNSIFLVAELDESKKMSSCFLPSQWNQHKTNGETNQNKYTGWLAGQGFIVGILGLWNMANEGHIVTLAVRRDYRKLGVGGAILRHCLRICFEKSFINVTLEVRASNKTAQSLYLKHGFKTVGVRKNYYTDDGEDALIMTTPNTNSFDYATLLDEHIRETE